ncbi:DMT family transporter [Nocardia altamirensis]|uniref:DMT family transporter n=1 Tax=Nocardia altamirensis TaxID=472158 RepID=UPI000AB3F8C4|nr:DMT family transporter [Nocardia altamirensis]
MAVAFVSPLVAVPSLSGISAAILAATLAAALLHASWNAIAHWIPDKIAAMTLVPLGCVLAAIPLIGIATGPSPSSWPYLAVSAVLHTLYNGLLMLSYRLGDLSQTYPLARGTAPLVVTVAAAVLLGETPRAGQFVGVLLISAGLVCLVCWGHRTNPSRPSAIAAALATGVVIASYTVVDGIGIRLAHSTLGYIAWLMLLGQVAIPFLVFCRYGRGLGARIRPVWHIGLTGGLLSIAAYGLILWAQTRGALAEIAALRETSIIVAAIVGTTLFGEKFGAPRILATCTVTAGIALMCLT